MSSFRSRIYPSGWTKKQLQKKKAAEKKKNVNALVERYAFTVSRKPTDPDLQQVVHELLETVVQQVVEVEEERSSESCYKESSSDVTSENIEIVSFNPDPATWIVIKNEMVEYFAQNPPPQNIDLLSETERSFSGVKRSLTTAHFYYTKINGEKLLRKWLVLSASSKMLFCWVCKLLNSNSSSKGQLITGFSDWKHAATRLKEHENSTTHKQAMMNLSLRSSMCQRIDSSLTQQYDNDLKYWMSVLKRVVAVIKFLSLRGLPFFGDNETIGSRHNGNFLGCLEIIAEFDPFLATHLEKHGNPGKGNVSYLSSTCVDQFIDLMSKKVLKQITNEILTAKYFSLIIDSTPDLAHVDQLCFVIRYVSAAEPVERFLKFIPIYSHKSESLADVILATLHDLEIDIKNCRGQSYDNASNMAGKYSGLQARIKSINPLADFVPCSAHSLNLVCVNAVESCSGALQFFSLVQQVYNFFSASTYRWQCLNEKIKENGERFTLKSHCMTRWYADAHAVKSLKKNYNSILNALISLASDGNALTKSEASALNKKLNKFETVLNIIIWDTLLQRINQTSMELQKPSLTLSRVVPLYESLIDFTQFVRDNFALYEDLARKICGENNTYAEVRKKFIPRSKDLITVSTAEVQMTARQAYISNIHYVISDALILHLSQRKVPYLDIMEKFACFNKLKTVSVHQEDSVLLHNSYPTDLADSFPDELQQFSSLIQNGDSVIQMLQKLKNLQLEDTFPNVETALRIFLTLPVSNCSGERSFSLLKRLKSPIRSNIQQNKLSSLALLCIEGDITAKLDCNDIIHDFACLKARKKVTF